MKKFIVLIVTIQASICLFYEASAQWLPQDCGITNCQLSGICFTDSNNGWAVGTDVFGSDTSIILHTSNGGDLWEIQYQEVVPDLKDVCFVDSLTGWVVGSDFGPGSTSIVLFTSDGGSNWNEQLSGLSGFMISVCFTGSEDGWIADYGCLWHTMDGGITWESQNFMVESYDVYFVDQDNGWVVGSNGKIFHTTDGGENWLEQSSGIYATTLLDVFFIDPNNGWVVGSGYTILHTNDGGDVWTVQYSAAPWEALGSVYFTDLNSGWAVGHNGGILTTTDGGNTWEDQESNTNYSLTSVFFVNTSLGWIAGYGGTILHTDNGGLTDVKKYESQNSRYRLQCYPNPFSDNLTISLTLPESSFAQIQIYNSRGKKVKDIDSRMFPGGKHKIHWKPGDLPPGIYLMQLQIGSEYISKKLIKVN